MRTPEYISAFSPIMESSEIVVWEKILALSPISTLSPMMVKAPIDTF